MFLACVYDFREVVEEYLSKGLPEPDAVMTESAIQSMFQESVVQSMFHEIEEGIESDRLYYLHWTDRDADRAFKLLLDRSGLPEAHHLLLLAKLWEIEDNYWAIRSNSLSDTSIL